MGIVRHDWYGDGNSGGIVCRIVESNGGCFERDKTPDCAGCGAYMPLGDELTEDIATEAGQSRYDSLWHEEYRPMAAMVSLLEDTGE